MLIRAVLGILLILALAFMADQEFADGHYTGIAQKAVTKARKTVGL
jgi:hypothetical protein